MARSVGARMKRPKNFLSLVLTAVLAGLAVAAAWVEASGQDYIGACNWAIFGAATLMKEGLHRKIQTKASIVAYLSAYILSLAAFLGIILRQGPVSELWLYSGLLGIWAGLTAWLAHAAFRAKSNTPNVAAR